MATTHIDLNYVHTNFKKYNFLIFTKMGTIDTSDYDVCLKASEQWLGHSVSAIQLYKKNPKRANWDALNDFAQDPIDGESFTVKDDLYLEKYVELVDRVDDTIADSQARRHVIVIDRIQIKSVRNFLNNQTPDKYLEQ